MLIRQNKELSDSIKTLKEGKINSLTKQIKNLKHGSEEKDAYIRQLTTQKSAIEKNQKDIEKDLKTVRMQYKLSICNNETLIKGLKQKINAFEESRKPSKSKGKENKPSNRPKQVKIDLKPKQDLVPILLELQQEKLNMQH